MQQETEKKYDLVLLIVEDTIEIQFLIKTVLRFYFREVITADNGLEGLEKFKAFLPDIVITDMSMPLMNGLEMSKEIREISSDVPIILQTAFDDKQMLIESIDIGIDSYLKKPLKNEKLISTVMKSVEMILIKKELQQQYAQNKKISLAIEHSPNRLLILNAEGTVEYCNPTFLSSTVLSNSVLIDSKLIDLNIEFIPDEIIKIIWESISNKKAIQLEFKHKTAENIWFSATLNKISHEDAITNFSLLFVDITLRKIAEFELQKSNENLEKRVQERTIELERAKEVAETASRSKSSFLAKVSHELRTPLNGILGLSSILLESEIREKEKNFLGMIYSSGKNLLSIINDILDYSKLDAGKMSISEHNLILEVIVKNVVEMLIKEAYDKGIIISYVIDNKIPNQLLGDSVRIQQVLTNLISNAIKFTDNGKVQIFVTLKELTHEWAEVLFEIRDTGIGIPKEKIPELFHSFSQVENYMTRTRGGTGLGLAICKEIVELMNGSIWVESEENKGSNFKFNLRLKNPDDKSSMNDLQSKEHDDLLSAVAADYPDIPLSILIAEDSLINQEVLKQGLSLKTWNIVSVDNGADAVEAFKSMDFDLIFMDIQMPIMDGLEATRLIRSLDKEQGSNTIIIALTAHALEIQKEDCSKSGMNGFITKPFQWRQIYSVIYSFFGNEINENDLKKSDLETLLKSINYNREVFKKIADYYQKNYLLTMSDIEEGLNNNNYVIVKEKLHKLKSELGNFGAEKAISIIRQMEEALSNNNPDSEKVCFDNLIKELKFLANEINKIDLNDLIQ